jgi:purine-binding chemotaxis protein CheW
MGIAGITEAGQYLTFTLDKETYAFDISQVREILDVSDITRVPQMPEFMLGVINLRGRVVPVIDLRLKFGLTKTEKTIDTCIIIIEMDIEGEATLLGTLADSVREVMTLEPDQIVPPPKIGTRLNTEFIKGMGKRNDEFVIIADIDKVFAIDEVAVFQSHEEFPVNRTMNVELNEDVSRG